MEIPDTYFEDENQLLSQQCQIVVHEQTQRAPETGKVRATQRVMAPRESVYEEYNHKYAPRKDPWVGYGPHAAQTAKECLSCTW